jgi:tetratricopeptide (TPR) repeat protein
MTVIIKNNLLYRFGVVAFLLWVTGPGPTLSQNDHGDSVQVRLQHFPNDTAGVQELLDLSSQSYHSDLKKAYMYASRAMEISQEIDYPSGLLHSKYYLAVFFSNSDFEIAETNLMEALQIADELYDTIMSGKIFNIAGLIKNNKKQYEDALVFFEKSLDCFGAGDKVRGDSLSAAVYNNMAISYLGLSQKQKAIETYFRALETNMASGTELWVATNYYNIGNEYLKSGDTVKALKYLQLSSGMAREKGFGSVQPYICNALNRYYTVKGQPARALDFARKAYVASKRQMNRLEEKHALMKMAEGFLEMGNYDSAYHYQVLITAITDSIYINSQTRDLDVLELRYRYQKRITEQESRILSYELDSTRRRVQIILIVLGSILVLLLLTFLLLSQRQLLKRRALEQKALRLEKENLSKQVEYKNKELTLNIMHQAQAGELLRTIGKKAKGLRFEGDEENRRIWNEILAELRANTNPKKWEDFQVSFKEVDNEFYRNLHLKFPSLTPNELRFAAFLKMNMSTKEISSLTFQSENAIKTARHRLRKKFGLGRDDNLTAFLNSI